MPKPLPADSPMNLTPEEREKLPDSAPGKNALVTLHGVAMKEDGTLIKSRYFNVLNNTLDDYSDIVMTPTEAQRLQNVMLNLSTGSTAAMPVLCTGDLCPWKSRCVYYQMGKAPVGRQCLVELNLMKQWMLLFLEEYQVDMENRTELFMVNELVEIELMLYRCNLNMALSTEEASGVVDQPVAVDNQGNAVYAKQISQFVELRERLLTRKHKLIKLMVGDRQEKYKREAALKVREDKDPSSQMSEVREKLQKLERELTTIQGSAKKISEETIPGKLGPLSPDDVDPNSDE